MDLWFNLLPPPLNGMAVGRTLVRIAPKGRGVAVRERPENQRHPNYCPERHIPDGGAFCLGVFVRPIRKRADADAWWADLHHFLALQAIAEQSGVWPAVHALSHGPDAAEFETEAREIAEKNGIADDYNRLVEGETNWLAVCVNGAKAPDGVTIGSLVLAKLLKLENARRRAVESYWKHEFTRGHRCCGTMLNCPLRMHEEAAGKIAAE